MIEVGHVFVDWKESNAGTLFEALKAPRILRAASDADSSISREEARKEGKKRMHEAGSQKQDT